MFCPKNYSKDLPRIDRLVICTFPLKGKLEVVGVCGWCHWMHIFPTKEDRVLDDISIKHVCKDRKVKISNITDLAGNLDYADKEIDLKKAIEKISENGTGET